MSRSAEVPNRWLETPLKDIASVSVSNVDKKSRANHQTVQLCNYMDVYSNDVLDDTHRYMTSTASPAEIQKFQLQPGDVVLTKDSESPDDIGVPSLLQSVQGTLVCGYHLAVVRASSEAVVPSVLARQLASNRLKAYFGKEATGSTRYGLRTSSIEMAPILLPPLPDQRRIAKILDTLDAAIQKTEALIAKLQVAKDGLLHDLLTRGVDENGELRDPQRQPEQFKTSELGLVPMEWRVMPLLEVVPTVDYGISSSLSSTGDVPVLRMNNFSGGEADLEDLKFASNYAVGTLLLKEGDVLFNRTNSAEHVGRTGIWRGQLDRASFASYLVRLNNDRKLLTSEFLNYWLNLPLTQIRVRRFATPGVSQVNVNPTNLRRVKIALPRNLHEQEEVVTFMTKFNHELMVSRHTRRSLASLKIALAEDLLSGSKVLLSMEALKDAHS